MSAEVTNRLMITVDVEARPPRSRTDPLERLIWGRFPEGEFGIGRMMEIAERHSVKLTMFLDYAEEHLYGDALLDVGREIYRRGHDLQLHLHHEFMPDAFYAALGIDRVDDFVATNATLANAYFDFLCDRHAKVSASQANAFRGYGYLYNGDILAAMKKHGLKLASNYNISRASQPMHFGPMPQFTWDSGIVEAPISTVFDFQRTRRHFDYNFNAAAFRNVDLDTCLLRHLEFLDRFYVERGDDAVAVLVLHSWSFLERNEDGTYTHPTPDAPERFDLLLSALGESVEVIDSRDMVALADAGELRLAGPFRFGAVRSVPDLATPAISAEPICPICGTKAGDFVEFNGGRRRCPDCGSVERQRVFAQVYETIRREFDLAGKDVLIVSPSVSERRFLDSRGITNLRSIDVRPEVKPDILADITKMPEVADASFDAIIASFVLTCVHDLDACLAELHRVLRPGGRLLTSDPIAFGAPTEEFDDPAKITAWYGQEVYEKYRVGNFRAFGDTDILRTLGRHFVVKTLYGDDAPTGVSVVWHMSIKPGELIKKGGSLPLPEARRDFAIFKCPLCDDPLTSVADKENCPGCGARARTRTLGPIVTGVVALLASPELRRDLPLLAFAMTGHEQRLLEPFFATFTSVSLYGTYATNHQSGVDVRDLSRFAGDSFAGAFSIHLFDYFPEHEQALREIYRVVAPGGVLFTLIGRYRLSDDSAPPEIQKIVESRSDYFSYLPPDANMPSVKVGRLWFVEAMRRAGFDADLLQVEDHASGLILDWFIGRKPPREATAKRLIPPKHAPAPPPQTLTTRQTTALSRTYSTAVDPAFGFSRISLTLTLPSLPEIARGTSFAEHAVDPDSGESTDTVIALNTGGILFSSDLGRSWEYRATPEIGDRRLRNAFTLADGHHLIQDTDPLFASAKPDGPRFQTEIFRFDRDWRFLDRVTAGGAHWHGTRSIDQRNGTIIYADYPYNAVSFLPDFEIRRAELERLCNVSRVFRSRDGGTSWETVLTKPWTEIRHFHTVAADPYETGVWWLSSGDRAIESRVWRSDDDGSTWTDVTDPSVDFPLQPRFERFRQSAFRFTDVVVMPDLLLWGTDDLLGHPDEFADPHNLPLDQRIGARVFVTAKTLPLRPQPVAFVGNMARSIVDVGPCYFVLTESGKHPLYPRPRICILSKTPPYLSTEIGTIDHFGSGLTGFTYSRASRRAKDGRFFTFRGSNDVFSGGPRLLQWDIDFQ